MTNNHFSFTLRVATGIGGGIVLINFTVWAMICAIAGHFETPWFLWASIPVAAILAPFWWSAQRGGRLLDK